MPTNTPISSGARSPMPLHNAELTEVGPGTPAGELLRRFWQPVGLSAELTDLPQAGRIEPEGIRCCYHGWLFDVEGRCLEQPCEPPESTYKHRVRQPGYPCHEYHGLVFAYLGPLDRMPVFPRYGLIEEGEGVVVADGTSYGLAGGVVLDCNWLQ